MSGIPVGVNSIKQEYYSSPFYCHVNHTALPQLIIILNSSSYKTSKVLLTGTASGGLYCGHLWCSKGPAYGTVSKGILMGITSKGLSCGPQKSLLRGLP